MTLFRNRDTWQALLEWGLLIALLAVAIVAIGGCAETRGRLDQEVKIVDPETGQVVLWKRTGNDSFSRAPGDAAGPTTQSITPGGIHSSVSGTHATTPAQIIAGNKKYFYFIAAGFGLVAVLGFGFKNAAIGVPAAIAAGAFGLTPWLQDLVELWLLPIAGLAIVGGIVWYAAKRHDSRKASALAAARLAEADERFKQARNSEGADLMRSATDVLMVNKPEFAKHFKRGQERFAK